MFHTRRGGERRHHHEGRREGRRGPGFGHGFGPEVAQGFGDRIFFRRAIGPGGFRGPGQRGMRRGEIRPLILNALTTKPMHGYEVIQALEEKSGGRWRPSAGSVYPTLQQLADEGLVSSQEIDGRRVYTLTDAGRAAAAANPAFRRWQDAAGDGEVALPDAIKGLFGAAMQVERMGTAHAREETVRILTNARKQVYRLLADDDAGTAPDAHD